MDDIIYTTGMGSTEEINAHLETCGNDFIPPLSQKINIGDYSKKITRNAVTFEARAGSRLVGLVAAYINDEKKQSAFITSVSTLKEFAGKGIAGKLMGMCTEYASAAGFKEIQLEVSLQNESAIRLYDKKGYQRIRVKDDMAIMKKVLP